MFTTLSVLGINVLAQLSKKLVEKYGETAVHAMIFILAVVIVGIKAFIDGNPQYKAILVQAGVILGSAVALYEILLKKIFSRMNI